MKDFYKGLLLAVAYFVFGKLSSYFGVSNSIITVSIFPPEGISLAMAVLFGNRVVWGIFLGQTLYALSNHLGVAASSLIGITNSLEALLAVYFVRRWKIDLGFGDVRSVLLFFFLIIIILQPWSALLGNTVLLLFADENAKDFWINVGSWYLGNVVAQLVITPMLLLLYKAYSEKELDIGKLLVTILIFAAIFVLLVVELHLDNMALLFSIAVAGTFIVSYRFGIVYGSVAINIISTTMILLTQNGIGVFTLYDKFNNIVNLNFFMLGQVFLFYIDQAMYKEKEQLLQEVENANKNLQKRVEEEVAKNREKEKFLMYQSRLAQMGEMINMIAHQWRQPLNSISIIVQTLGIKFKNGSLTPEGMDELQKKILHQIDHMSETIDAFRDFFKPKKEAEVFDLGDVVSNVVDMSRFEIQKKGIDFEYRQKEKIVLKGYPNELGQAILNIVNNAKEQLEQKNSNEKRIAIDVISDDEGVEIKISDTAGGIDEQYIERIFEPYFSTKEGKNGTGLGLYITKMIVEEHMGGKLSVKNSEKGAIFTIELNRDNKEGE